jgi:hypothetical protein
VHPPGGARYCRTFSRAPLPRILFAGMSAPCATWKKSSSPQWLLAALIMFSLPQARPWSSIMSRRPANGTHRYDARWARKVNRPTIYEAAGRLRIRELAKRLPEAGNPYVIVCHSGRDPATAATAVCHLCGKWRVRTLYLHAISRAHVREVIPDGQVLRAAIVPEGDRVLLPAKTHLKIRFLEMPVEQRE